MAALCLSVISSNSDSDLTRKITAKHHRALMDKEKGEVLLGYQFTHEKRLREQRKKRWRSEKCAGGRGEHFTDNFLISGEEEICEKGRSERFQVEHWKVWVSTTMLFVCLATAPAKKSSQRWFRVFNRNQTRSHLMYICQIFSDLFIYLYFFEAVSRQWWKVTYLY